MFVLAQLNVPEASPAFKDHNNYHLFKWYGEEFSAGHSVLYRKKKLHLTPATHMRTHTYNLHLQ